MFVLALSSARSLTVHSGSDSVSANFVLGMSAQLVPLFALCKIDCVKCGVG